MFIVAATALSGCLGGDDEDAGDEEEFEVPTGEYNDDDCALEGIVVDDEVNLVIGAQVGIRETEHMTQTAADGRFAFSHVAPGHYTLEASKGGFNNGFIDTDCVKGELNSENTIQLLPTEAPVVAYYDPLGPFDGKIHCALGLTSSGSDLCNQYLPSENYRYILTVTPDVQPITGVVIELDWDPTGAQGGEFLKVMYESLSPGVEVDARTNALHEPALLQVSGTPGFQLVMETKNTAQHIWLVEEGGSQQFKVYPASNTTPEEFANNDHSSKLLLEQGFQLYVTYFYNGAEIPQDYSALPS